MVKEHLLSLAALFSAVMLILYPVPFLSSPGVANPGPALPQMMGGHGTSGGMMRHIMRDNVPPGVKSRDLPAPNSKGARLTVRHCSQCHGLASPSMHTAKEWNAVAARIFRRISVVSARGMMGMSVSMPSAEQQGEINPCLPSNPRAQADFARRAWFTKVARGGSLPEVMLGVPRTAESQAAQCRRVVRRHQENAVVRQADEQERDYSSAGKRDRGLPGKPHQPLTNRYVRDYQGPGHPDNPAAPRLFETGLRSTVPSRGTTAL